MASGLWLFVLYGDRVSKLQAVRCIRRVTHVAKHHPLHRVVVEVIQTNYMPPLVSKAVNELASHFDISVIGVQTLAKGLATFGVAEPFVSTMSKAVHDTSSESGLPHENTIGVDGEGCLLKPLHQMFVIIRGAQ